jgi:hypothetical protein
MHCIGSDVDKLKAVTESFTGNAVFLGVVGVLAAVVIIPVWQGRLTQEALTNLSIAAMQALAAIAMAAAGWHWRGKVATPSGTGNGATTITPPAGTSSVTTVETPAP